MLSRAAIKEKSSCPALCRASTPYFQQPQDVDGRDKPGHDAGGVTAQDFVTC
jgi:hypothetical protein